MPSPIRRLTAFVEAYSGLPDIMKLDPTKKADLTLGDLRELLAELEWRPIETAPRDGTPVQIGRFSDIYGFVGGIGYYINALDISGWIAICGFDKVAGVLGLGHPTHWRPLPEPPLPQPSREGETKE